MFFEITAIPLHRFFIMQTRQECFLAKKSGVNNLALLAFKEKEEAISLCLSVFPSNYQFTLWNATPGLAYYLALKNISGF
jgi:hypothetical protein